MKVRRSRHKPRSGSRRQINKGKKTTKQNRQKKQEKERMQKRDNDQPNSTRRKGGAAVINSLRQKLRAILQWHQKIFGHLKLPEYHSVRY